MESQRGARIMLPVDGTANVSYQSVGRRMRRRRIVMMIFERMHVMRQRMTRMRRLDNALDWATFVQTEVGALLSVCVHAATMRNAVLGNGMRILAASTRKTCIPVKVSGILSHSNRS
jgi:hypothetical protein